METLRARPRRRRESSTRLRTGAASRSVGLRPFGSRRDLKFRSQLLETPPHLPRLGPLGDLSDESSDEARRGILQQAPHVGGFAGRRLSAQERTDELFTAEGVAKSRAARNSPECYVVGRPCRGRVPDVQVKIEGAQKARNPGKAELL